MVPSAHPRAEASPQAGKGRGHWRWRFCPSTRAGTRDHLPCGDVLRGGSLELLGRTEPACAHVWLGVNQTLHPQHTPGTRNLHAHACAERSC